MSDSAPAFRPWRRFGFLPERDSFYRWWVRLAGSPRFQSRASASRLTRGVARSDGERLFDLVAGFVHSQVLAAFVRFDLADILAHAPLPVWKIAVRSGLDVDKAEILCRAAAALGLLRRHRDGRYGLGRLGAALPGVPGLAQMIRHHEVLYRDLADPEAVFRAGAETELANFWPYVFGAQGARDPETAATYSRLMSDTQGLVAEETLRTVSLDGVRRLMDVGGGTGAFLRAVQDVAPDLDLTLFDLPAVVAKAEVPEGTAIVPGSFRDDALPEGHDAISLVRVLYDHADATVTALLARVFAALPPGGQLIVSEPMLGDDRPNRAGDVYFALYTLAMQTGQTRSPSRIAALLKAAGFEDIAIPRTHRPFVTSVVTARKPS